MRRHSIVTRLAFLTAFGCSTVALNAECHGPPLAPLAIGQSYTSVFEFDSEASATPAFGGSNDYIGVINAASFSIGAYNGTLAAPSASTISTAGDWTVG